MNKDSSSAQPSNAFNAHFLEMLRTKEDHRHIGGGGSGGTVEGALRRLGVSA